MSRLDRPVPELLADQAYCADALEEAVNGLATRHPELSAAVPFTVAQKVIGLTLAAIWVVATFLWPAPTTATVVSLASLMYIASLIDRLIIFRRGLASGAISISDDVALAIPDEELPYYTVLVPAYDEPEVVGDLLAAVDSLQYPREKLQVLLLLEADDRATIEAADAASVGDVVTIVLVPPAQPRTKPKACTYGLHFSIGDIITIFDAEDQPDPLQLRRAVAAFAMLDDDAVACVQAKLSFHNAGENLLTAWFTADYGIWFGYLLPGVMASKAPIPLGGTSNHFRRDVLDEIGAWDPYNVTEDADLGVRIAARGYRTAVLDSVTLEEANNDPINWIRQRSRWYKGYMQTWLVHIAHPVRLYRTLGPMSFIRYTLLTAGTPLIAALNMLFWMILLIWLTGRPAVVAELFPGPIYYLALVSLVIGNSAAIYMNLVAIREDDRPDLLLAALLVPLYWAMMSVAAIKGLWQLIVQPSYWEKTFHGLSKINDAPADTGGTADGAG